MNSEELAEKLLQSYSIYYDVKTEDVREPFFAEAVFHNKDEQYFLVKSAKLSEVISNEYVYFAKCGTLTEELLTSLSDSAWDRALSGFVPERGHKNSDVSLFILSEEIPKETEKLVSRIKKYKSYQFTLLGFSRFSLVAIDVSRKHACFNRVGRLLEKVVWDIIH